MASATGSFGAVADQLYRHTMTGQEQGHVGTGLLAVLACMLASVQHQQRDFVGQFEQRQCIEQGARAVVAAIPGQQRMLAGFGV
jgi:hypothetical protein